MCHVISDKSFGKMAFGLLPKANLPDKKRHGMKIEVKPCVCGQTWYGRIPQGDVWVEIEGVGVVMTDPRLWWQELPFSLPGNEEVAQMLGPFVTWIDKYDVEDEEFENVNLGLLAGYRIRQKMAKVK